MSTFLETSEAYTAANIETFAYLLGEENAKGELVLTVLAFPEQGCSDIAVSGVEAVGIIHNVTPRFDVIVPQCTPKEGVNHDKLNLRWVGEGEFPVGWIHVSM